MLNELQNSFIESLNGEVPTPDQAAQLLEMAGQGDSGTNAPQTGSEPTASTDTGASPTGEAGNTDTNADLDPAKALIMAKDGKHTIGYEKLVEARESAKQYKAQAEAAQAELLRLQEEAQARAAAGDAATKVDNQVAAAQAAIDAGTDPAIFGDFSEEALAKGIQTLVKAQVADEVKAAVSQALAPIQRKQIADDATAHYNAIYEKHPDADSIAESKELADWIASQPSFVQNGYRNVLDKGTTNEVIELFDRFKQATGIAQAPAETNQQNSAEQVKARAKAAVANAAAPIPTSLTDIPGGKPGGVTFEEQLAAMTGPEMLQAMEAKGWSPQQIETYLNRSL